MSITSVNRRHQEQRAGDSPSGKTQDDVYEVQTNVPQSQLVGISAEAETAGLPKLCSTVIAPDGEVLEVRTRQASMVDPGSRLVWHVTVHYEIQRGSTFSGTDKTPVPTDEQPQIRFGSVARNLAVQASFDTVDIVGLPQTPIENSAGDPFDPPLDQDQSNLVIFIQRNETSEDFSPDIITDFKDTMNVKAIAVAGISIGALQGLFRDISADRMFDAEGTQYWSVTYQVEVDRKTHVRAVLDRGFNILGAGPGFGVSAILDNDLKPVNEPRKLDGAGAELAAGADPVYLDFQTYDTTNWEILALPLSQNVEEV